MTQKTKRTPLPHLTAPELEIMQALWQAKRLSAREIHERVAPTLGWAYSTTRTTVTRMLEKGHVQKVQVHGLSVYEPAITRATGLARRVSDFAREVLGSGPSAVLTLIDSSEALSEAELEELRALLDSREGQR